MAATFAADAAAHIHEADGLVRFAERARNADRWTGDRNADSLGSATLAIPHALLAINATLERVAGVLESLERLLEEADAK